MRDNTSMIVGIGTDLVDVARLSMRLERAPQLVERTLTSREQEQSQSPTTLAACFAVKEAVLKVLGSALAEAQQPVPSGWKLSEIELLHHASGAPRIALCGQIAQIASKLGIARWQVSISHDAGVAVAFVIAES